MYIPVYCTVRSHAGAKKRSWGRKKEGGRNTTLWPKLAAAAMMTAEVVVMATTTAIVCSHRSNKLFVYEQSNNGHSLSIYVAGGRSHAHTQIDSQECVILLWQSLWVMWQSIRLFRFICCHFDCCLYCIMSAIIAPIDAIRQTMLPLPLSADIVVVFVATVVPHFTTTDCVHHHKKNFNHWL